MARTRKAALDKIQSLVTALESHLAKIAAYPGHSSTDHWKHEVHTWLRDMEALLRHVGKKTSAQWQARIDAWRAAIER
jgi:hypothetical protein